MAMPIDEAKLRKAVREAAYDSNKQLKDARSLVRAVDKRFGDGFFSGVGVVSLDSLGRHLERRQGDELAAAHQHLKETMKKAEAAVEQALQAVKRMADAAR